MATNELTNLRSAAVALIGFALLVRGGMLIAGRDSLRADPDGYRRLAENVVQFGTFGHGEQPTAFRPPLYPLLLAWGLAVGPSAPVSVALLHLAAGVATVWLVYWMGRRWGLGRYALLAGVMVACDPILLAQSTVVMTETVAALLAVVAVAALSWTAERPTWRRALVAGGCLGLAALCRPTFLPFALGAVVMLPLVLRLPRLRRRSIETRSKSEDTVSEDEARRVGVGPSHTRRVAISIFLAGVMAAGLALVLMLWAMRNQLQLGRPIVTTSHGGYTLLLANNPQFYEYLRSGAWGSVWDVKELEAARQPRLASLPPRTELEADRLAYDEAKANICREPAMFAYSCLVRVGRLWAPLPHQLTPDEAPLRRWARYAVALWYALELPLAAAGTLIVWRGREKSLPPPWVWWVLMAGVFTAVHAVFWTDMRMRAPLMPGVALAAALAIARIARRS